MKKKHAASPHKDLSLCGYGATKNEYIMMVKRRKRQVTCARCLKRIKETEGIIET